MANIGCCCAAGTFYNGSACVNLTVSQCASVAGSVWNGGNCVCSPGYTSIQMQCVCVGLAVNSTYCDQCYNKPNSNWVNGICQCNTNFVNINGVCTASTNGTVSNSTAPSCNVATYWDSQKMRCFPCSSGCLSCTTCYECTSCQPGFYLDFAS
jgi:hypothetical protein